MRYTTLLFDLDHTLFDSVDSERQAFAALMRSIGVEAPERYFATYTAINGALWASLERGEIRPEEVRVTRFERLVRETDLEANPETMADVFAQGLGDCGALYPGARQVLETVAEGGRLALITNGLADVQRARIERLELAELFDALVISAEVGVSKPSRGIFDATFQALGSPTKESALILGDSLTSDIRGGSDYGIASCWYNPHRKPMGDQARPSFEIEQLHQFPDLVTTGLV